MGWRKRGVCVCVQVLAFLTGAQAASRQDLAPNRFQQLDVFELEYASDPQISPDGTRIVYVRNSMDIMKDRRQSRLWIIRFDGSQHRPLTGREAAESSPRWSPDGSRILYTSQQDGKAQLYLRWMDTGQTTRLTHLLRPPRGITWSPDGKWIAFSMLVPEAAPRLARMPPQPKGAEWAPPARVITKLRNRADGSGYLEEGHRQLFLLPAEGGTPRQLTFGPYHQRSAPAWSPDGKTLIFSANRNPDWEYQFRNSELYALSIEDGSIQPLTERNGPDHSPTLSPDGRRIAYLGYDDHVQTYQVTHLYVMNRDGSDKRLLLPGLNRDVAHPVWDPRGGGIFFQYDDRGNTKIAYADLKGSTWWLGENLGGTSIGRPYGGGSFSVSSKGRFVYTWTDPHHPADVAVGQSDEADVHSITSLNQDLLDQRELGRVEEIEYASSFDGRKIQGWVVTPPGFDSSRQYPLLLEIHGGPVANYGDRFSAEIQLYAAAGYVVFYANPRGSTSYGQEFGNLIHHHYPGEDYDDLMSGVHALVTRGFIDPNNLFVTGGSAGGIMTAWIVGKTSRFRAAVAAKPVINWYSKVLVADNYYAYHNYRYPGSPWENPEAYLRYSPISLVGQVATPTLLMVGERDLRTPPSEAEQFFQALKLRRVETALVRLPGASHHISARPSQLIAKVAHTLAWFEKYRDGGSTR